MEIFKLAFDQIPQLSKRDKAYQNADSALRPFYKYEVDLEAFPQVIEDKQNEPVDRELLTRVLKEQYADFPAIEAVDNNIERLAAGSTFSVITAHQPSLFTGPLYFVLKIASAIRLSEILNKSFTNFNFVPVFVVGGEDHDFEEVNHLNLFGNKLTWDSGQTGSVGRMSTASLKSVMEELFEILGSSPNAESLKALISDTYGKYESYGQATAAFVHQLFGKFGLVVSRMDHPDLKRRMIPLMKKEILHQASRSFVEASQQALEESGFSSQAFAREINFFYLQEGSRERIILNEDGKYEVNNTDLVFSKEEMEILVEEHPERFSPNVVMRPLYQEHILPNLAYIGGGGELAYWMERKEQFAHFGINFPMLIRRNSILWIDKGSSKKMDKLGLSVEDIFQDPEMLIKEYVKTQSESSLGLQQEKADLAEVFDRVLHAAEEVDKSLRGAVEAEKTRQIKSLENLEQRILRAEKQKHETQINQIRGLLGKLFPNNGLQERHDNFMGIYLKNGEEFIDTLVENLDPLQKEFLVFQE